MKAWVARDKDGSLWLHLHEKPWKEEKRWYIESFDDMSELDSELCPEVKWEDDEPTEVEITIKPKKGGEE